MKLRKRLELKDAPHWFGSASTRTIFWKVCVSLIPIFAVLLFLDWRVTAGNLAGALMAGFGLEFIFRALFDSKPSLKDGDLFLICLVLTPLLPNPVNLKYILFTIFFSWITVRRCFGGRGGAVFYAIPIGLLASGLLTNGDLRSSLLAFHSNWFLTAAIVLSALWASKSAMVDFLSGWILVAAALALSLLFNSEIFISNVNVLIYSALWIFSDAPKPCGKKARFVFALLCGIYSGIFYLRLEFVQAILTSILFINLFAHEIEEYFLA